MKLQLSAKFQSKDRLDLKQVAQGVVSNFLRGAVGRILQDPLEMFFLKKKPRFREIATLILRSKELKSLETRKAAAFQLRRLIRNFGDLAIDELEESHWTEYVLRELAGKNRKFFDDRKYMRQCLRHAWKRELIARVPELPIPDLPWTAGREISQEELFRLEASAGPTLRFQIRIGWKMGLRLREMLRLRWDQADLEKGVVVLRPSETKTRRGRQVPIPPDLIGEFRARMARAACQFIFPSRGLRKPQHSNKTAWRRCKAKSHVKARWHDLRHTCATLLLRRGVRIHIAKEYLGMSEQVLTKIYAHSSAEDLQRAAELMAE